MKNVDVVFVIPPSLGRGGFPHGVSILIALLKKAFFNVNVVDASSGNLAIEDTIEKISEIKPKIVALPGFSYTTYFQYNVSLGLMDRLSSAIQIAGGWWASPIPELVLKKTRVNYIIKGEADLVINDICEALIKGISVENMSSLCNMDGQGVYRENTMSQFPKKLDLLPLPAYECFNMDYYCQELKLDYISNLHHSIKKRLKNKKCLKQYQMISGRGCYGKCDFCSAAGLQRRDYSPKYVVDHMEFLINRYRADAFLFDDSLTLSTKKWTKEFCKEIISRELNILYSVQSRGDFNYDDETLYLLRESGCYRAMIGFESGNNEMLKKMSKNINVERYHELINDYRKYNIEPRGTFILNMPGETEKSLRDTLNFIKKSKVTFGFGLAFPYPGTGLFDYVNAKGVSGEEVFEGLLMQHSKMLIHSRRGLIEYLKIYNFNDLSSRIIWKIKRLMNKYAVINEAYFRAGSETRYKYIYIFRYMLLCLFPNLIILERWLKKGMKEFIR